MMILMRLWRRKVREPLLPKHMVVSIAMEEEAMDTVMVGVMAMSIKKKALNPNYIEVNALV